MARFIKSKVENRAFNRNYITYIRIKQNEEYRNNYSIVIGYAPCNDFYSEKVLADDLNINKAEEEYDKYLLELEEEPSKDLLEELVSMRGW